MHTFRLNRIVRFFEVFRMTTRKVGSNAVVLLVVLTLFLPPAYGGTWTQLSHLPPAYVSTPLLLTDGSVIVQEVHSGGLGTGIWYRLTPDNTGSYANGTWTQIASTPSGYAPDFYASAVLPDGRVIVEGGEYNGNNNTPVETNLGAIYDPTTNAWTSVTAPGGWTQIGDAQSAILANGELMLGNCCGSGQALLNATNLTWTLTGSGKADSNSEEGWTLLPSGEVLTVDIWNIPSTELYNPITGTWSSAGNTPSSLVALCETGPAVLRPDGTVIAFGSTGSTAIYNSSTGAWSAGPAIPSGFVAQDVPAALLPNGNVLVAASNPGTGTCTSPSYTQHTYFYELSGSVYTLVGGPTGNFPYENRFLVLPNGTALWTHNSNDVEVYTPSNSTYQSSWQPTVSSVGSTLFVGETNNVIQGTQFNGLSQGAMFGDDAQMASNYPMVRLTNNSTGHVWYARTHNHSTMGVATGSATVSTYFDMPPRMETGASKLVVVANGIPSNPVNVTVATSCSTSLSCVLHPTIVLSQISIACTYPTSISTSTQVCVPTVSGQQCSPWNNGASGVLTSSTANAANPPGTVQGPPNVCNYQYNVAGQNYQTQLDAH